jgi:drug/metabolite transporter (DMT)-like permease
VNELSRLNESHPWRDVTGSPARSVGQATLSLYLVPAAAIVTSLAWLSQIPGPAELAGGVRALAGVILASTRAG